ncbi:MAG: surface-adhesin E family protein [Thermodesulfobacteriota bacterium]
MKRTVVIMAGLLSLLIFSATAGAAWHQLASSQSGSWVISHKIFSTQGDCKTFAVLLKYKEPKQVSGRSITQKKFVVEACCNAKTFRRVSVTLVDSTGKDVDSAKVDEVAHPPTANSVADYMVRKICTPGFAR